MEFKDRLAELRKELGISQEAFAKEIGLSRTAVSAWEIGRNEPSASDIIKIANYFKVPTDYLLGVSNIKQKRFSEMKRCYLDTKGLNKDDFQEIQRQINYLIRKNKLKNT